MEENVRDMDQDLKEEIRRYFKREWEGMSGYAEDFADGLEEYLKEKGFDLGCVIQYNKKINK